MPKDYVENVDGAYQVAQSRVSLDSVVYAFLRGESPDGIAESFPALTLEQIYGAIAFYLGHRDTIDAYLRTGKADFARLREQARRDHPSLYAKIEEAGEGLVVPVPSCYDIASDLAGAVKGLPEDLAGDPKYLEGFGH